MWYKTKRALDYIKNKLHIVYILYNMYYSLYVICILEHMYHQST